MLKSMTKATKCVVKPILLQHERSFFALQKAINAFADNTKTHS